jgi:hypothetical protein
MTKRPPIGIPPKWITEEFRNAIHDPFQITLFDFKRFLAIKHAIERYHKAGMLVPQDWAFEDAEIRYTRLYSSIAKN